MEECCSDLFPIGLLKNLSYSQQTYMPMCYAIHSGSSRPITYEGNAHRHANWKEATPQFRFPYPDNVELEPLISHDRPCLEADMRLCVSVLRTFCMLHRSGGNRRKGQIWVAWASVFVWCLEITSENLWVNQMPKRPRCVRQCVEKDGYVQFALPSLHAAWYNVPFGPIPQVFVRD